MFVDIDNFKLANDSLDHHRGERLLRAIAQRLSGVLALAAPRHHESTLARPGGDEFIVLCEGLATERDAVTVAQQLQDALRAPFFIDGRLAQVTAALAASGPRPARTRRVHPRRRGERADRRSRRLGDRGGLRPDPPLARCSLRPARGPRVGQRVGSSALACADRNGDSGIGGERAQSVLAGPGDHREPARRAHRTRARSAGRPGSARGGNRAGRLRHRLLVAALPVELSRQPAQA